MQDFSKDREARRARVLNREGRDEQIAAAEARAARIAAAAATPPHEGIAADLRAGDYLVDWDHPAGREEIRGLVQDAGVRPGQRTRMVVVVDSPRLAELGYRPARFLVRQTHPVRYHRRDGAYVREVLS